MNYSLIKKIRSKLKESQPTIGCWQQIPHPSISEILSDANYDWIAIDLEHGSININSLPNLFRSIQLNNTLPIARIAVPGKKDCKQALDAGAGGIIIPMIESGNQLKKIINYSCWPPNGSRGVGFSRANMFGKNFEAYKKEARNPLIIGQIENKRAIKNLKSILTTKGLDAIMIGPYDLSSSLGIIGDFKSKLFKDTVKDIIFNCKKYNIPYGDHIVNPDKKDLENKINEGYTFLAYGTDGVFLNQNCQNPN